MESQPPLKFGADELVEVIRVRLGQLMDLGSALAGLGCPVWWCAQTVRLAPACLLLAAGGKEVRTCPGCAHLDWPENAGSTSSPNLFLWLTFNSHNTFRFSRACLQRASEMFAIHI